ncbi:MAG TPA: hypothetical protein VMG31_03655 [Verrucomicrobiae bacterium]|nr:hypothetical protein [Verrucomicrobiae bacterium]
MTIRVYASWLLLVLIISSSACGQAIPRELWGKWRIARELPARTISCWGESDAKKIIGTQVEYSERFFRWNQITISNPASEARVVTANQFREENSSPSSNGSQVDFRQLGISAEEVKEISIHHERANVSGATVEIPGDVLVKDENTIVFSVCNLYFEAERVSCEEIG